MLATLDRRALLNTLPLAGAALLLARCAGTTGATVSQTVANDLALVQNTLPAVLTAFSSAGVTVPTNVVSAIDTAVGVADSVAAGDAMSADLPTIQRAVADATTAANAVKGVTNAPSLAVQIANAVLALLPAILTAVGIFTAAAPAPGAMTADQARAFLRGVAAR